MTRLQAHGNAAAIGAIPVFFTEKMVASVTSFSPSAGKPRDVVKSWQRLSIPLKVMEPVPVSREQLYLGHDKAYVDGVLGCQIPNGFGNCNPAVAGSLLYTSGSMLSAAREAIKNGVAAVAPAAGFHHAGYDFGGGFCSLNALAVAACVLLNEGKAKRVGICDLDTHFADGTEDIIKTLRLEHAVPHFTAGAKWHRKSQAYDFLILLPSIVEAFAGCDVLLYQAGVDCHVDDELGGGWMTTPQMTARDRIVFQTCRRIGLPVSWCLGGGYQSPLRRILNLHDQTMQMCASVFATLPEGIEMAGGA
jgi:acetoin utilization deacetylase AcuC-like enzyme